MKIVHIILTHSFAGSERHAVELANLQAEQHDVTMILHQRGCEQRPDAIAHRLSAKVKIQTVRGWKPVAIWQCRQRLRQLMPDVAHAHLSAACRALHGVKGLCLRVATLHIHYKKQQHSALDALIAIAPWQLESIPAPLRANSRQIDNWSLPTPADPDARTKLRRQYGIADDAIVFGALGRVEHSKGHDMLVQAFQQAAIPNSRLVIVGQGSSWQQIRQQAPADVIMPGFSEEPHNWLRCFDIFISTARTEPFGLVFLEAMHAGLPILATATDGASYLQPCIGRPLTPIDDVDAMAQAMREHANATRQKYPMEQYLPIAKADEVLAFYQKQLA